LVGCQSSQLQRCLAPAGTTSGPLGRLGALRANGHIHYLGPAAVRRRDISHGSRRLQCRPDRALVFAGRTLYSHGGQPAQSDIDQFRRSCTLRFRRDLLAEERRDIIRVSSKVCPEPRQSAS